MGRIALTYEDTDRDRHRLHKDTVEAINDLAGIEFWVETPPVPNTEFVVNHSMRFVPRGVVKLLSNVEGSIYASRLQDWNDRRIFLRFSGGADKVLLHLR